MKPVRSRELKEGELIGGRYRVVRAHSEGGMGRIYEGMQTGLERKVAIKTVQPSAEPGWLERFLREAEVSKRLTHPNTIRIYDVGESDDGVPFMAMEFLEGRTLKQVIAKGALPLEVVAEIAGQVLGSLMEAHAAGIVHRDIKPSNLMLCKQIGRPNFIKVLDFGIAHFADAESAFETQAGLVVGTPHYMSPEQARGETPDERSDLYSLGITLFELVTGSAPYSEGSPLEIAMQHLLPDRLEMSSELRSTPLGKVIRKATEKVVENRYQSASDMLMAVAGQRPAEFAAFADSSPPSQPEEEPRVTATELDESPTRLEPSRRSQPPTTAEPPNTAAPPNQATEVSSDGNLASDRSRRVGTLTLLVGLCLLAVAVLALTIHNRADPERSGSDATTMDDLEVDHPDVIGGHRDTGEMANDGIALEPDHATDTGAADRATTDAGVAPQLETAADSSDDSETRRVDRSRADRVRERSVVEPNDDPVLPNLEPDTSGNTQEDVGSEREDHGQNPTGMPVHF